MDFAVILLPKTTAAAIFLKLIMNQNLRIALFADSFVEVNGAAMTCNKLERFANKNGLPFLCIYAGDKAERKVDGSTIFIEYKRSPISIPVDSGLKYDPLFQRYNNRILKELYEFKPDVIHITGLNDVSISGAYLAWKLQIPVLASWHTNLHEFAATRLQKLFSFLPKNFLDKTTGFASKKILSGSLLYYKMGKVILSPNQELVDILANSTGRKSALMGRGVDTDTFSPKNRTVNDGIFRFGFVGRLRAEKNVRLFYDLESELLKAGKTNFKFLIVGDGDEREWLAQNMKNVELTGFLEGKKLAEAYANMDCFVFASETDAFGNVAQEANASGVPVIVSDKGGPKFIIKHGETGFVASNLEDFTKYSIEILDNPETLAKMRKAAREFALSRSWDTVFEGVYQSYADAVEIAKKIEIRNLETAG